jgi:hypothetical protein
MKIRKFISEFNNRFICIDKDQKSFLFNYLFRNSTIASCILIDLGIKLYNRFGRALLAFFCEECSAHIHMYRQRTLEDLSNVWVVHFKLS